MHVLLDTNILLYACMEQDVEKMRIAEDVLRHTDCHISVQSLNEMTNTLRRKTKLSLDDIGELIADIRSLTTVHDLTTGIYARGWAIVRRYGLQTYDSMILACAIENGLETVLSEDMQDGLSIFDMTIIRNPFG
ncbi:PIN domain-containing protein [Gluconobacter cerinus]|uniref:PIN domain-containing protein n=1 Tax=Gluconobacter cerinus TaxID=38307 RepID=UPI001B8CF1BF|nr:PIN domain-containing protein [Gluconobacter cerinus]MBS1042221.1 PIN domain-containing protein [Gluconobacter cerinus]MBS1048807.1 PIN domain-containing protein [Gluconobacter cerinus]